MSQNVNLGEISAQSKLARNTEPVISQKKQGVGSKSESEYEYYSEEEEAKSKPVN